MFVDPIRGRSRGFALVATAVFAAGACNDPGQNTDLRPEGPPEVLAVLVMTDAATQLAETATYCALNDEKRPTQVGLPDYTLSQICDADPEKPADMVTEAYPDGWYIRVMFDELLDPDVEELNEIVDPDTGEGTDTFEGSIANTHPVKLECESVNGTGTTLVEVDYDGYYSPAGNTVTWPLGPSLVIKPNSPELVGTTKMCQVTLNENIVDKSGTPVPADQRGPFKFKIAAIKPILIDPSDGAEVPGIQIFSDNIYVQFNTASIDEASLGCDDGVAMDQCEYEFTPDAGGAYGYSLEPYGFSGAEYGFGPNDALESEKEYTFQFKAGAKVKDHCGVETAFGTPSVADQTKITFTTAAFDFLSNAPADGDTATGLKKLSLGFNNVVDPTSLLPGEYMITPAPELASVDTTTGGDFLFLGNYKPGQMYTFTLNSGATVLDAHGALFTQSGARTITWTIAPIAITSTTPANNGTSTKATPASLTTLRIAFNQAMDPTTLDAAEWSVVDANNAVVPFNAAATTTDCAEDSTTCRINLTSTGALAPGNYKLTLKMGATISDQLTTPTVYTQAADRVVNFTVKEAVAPTPIVCL